MPFSFECPACQTTVSGSNLLAGRKVRCPACDQVVTVPAAVREEAPAGGGGRGPSGKGDAKGTVYLSPEDAQAGETVMLDSVDVVEPKGPVEVFEAVDAGPPIVPSGPIPPPSSTDIADEPPPPVAPRRKLEEAEMDMTPMVDVTFLLLIFFMVTAAFTLQKSLEIPKPSDQDPSTNVVDEEPDEQSDFVTVKVDEYNTYFVTTVDWEEEAPSEQDLHIHLRRARDGDSTGTVPTKLRVEAHGESLHEKVVAALDAGTATGFEEVQLTTIEDD